MNRIGDFYIDLGTANTLIYAKSKGFKVNQPTLMTHIRRIERESRPVAFGDVAKRMLGKNHSRLSLLKPLKEGVISDFESTLQWLDFFIHKVGDGAFLRRSRLLISLPYQVTEHERNAIEEIGKNLGAYQVDLINEPLAAAIGAGLDVLGSRAKMIVDIGGGTSETAVVALGGVVVSKAKRVGGESLDEAIMDHLKAKYHFAVGPQTAEHIKMTVAHAGPKRAQLECEVGGIDLNVGLPRKIKITSPMIIEPVEHFVKDILEIVTKTFEDCPPEIAGDLAGQGVWLSGGGALLQGLDQRLCHETGVNVQTATSPLLCVAKGGAQVLEDPRLFDQLEAG